MHNFCALQRNLFILFNFFLFFVIIFCFFFVIPYKGRMRSNDCKANKNSRSAPRSILSQIAMVSDSLIASGTREERSHELELMFDGLKKYQFTSFRRPDNPDVEVLKEVGVSRLLLFPSSITSVSDSHSIFIVPSLVNGYEIMDILPQKSLINWFRARGYNVYVLDWGDLKSNADIKSVDDLYESVLGALLKEAYHHNNDEQLIAFGYCMGGSLLVPLAQKYKEFIRKCVFVATPWDFRVGDQSFTKEIDGQRDLLSGYLLQADFLPMDWLQVLFSKIDPMSFKNKFSRFAQLDPDSLDAKIFVSVEDWLNNGYDLPSYVARMTLNKWYQDNFPASKKWTVMGEDVDASKVDMPCLVVTAETDKLVPPESSYVLHNQLPNSEFIKVPCGHVGLMVSKNCDDIVWSKILHWLA